MKKVLKFCQSNGYEVIISFGNGMPNYDGIINDVDGDTFTVYSRGMYITLFIKDIVSISSKYKEKI
jgi:hypothetical protein